MFDHLTIRVADINETKIFYTKTLKPLGYKLEKEISLKSVKIIGFSKNGKCDTWFTTDSPVSAAVHIAWKADSKEQVNAFYEAALKAGGKSNGEPASREYKSPNYYAAFIIDPNGHNIEAFYGN